MKRLPFYLALLCVVVLFVANLLYGAEKIPASDVFSILIGGDGAQASWS